MMEIRDHSGLSGIPERVFRPSNKNELSDFLLQNPNSRFRIGGGLTGVSGAAVPEKNEIFIDMGNFRDLFWMDENRGIFFSGSGVTMAEIADFTRSAGWFFPVIPGSADRASLGGMIACNGGSALSLEYGKMSSFVMQLDVVLPDGGMFQSGSFCTKVSEGPALHQLLIGSEGTLGFICGAVLRCVRPVQMEFIRVSHPDFFSLLNILPQLLQLKPLMLEMADADALQFSSGVSESVVWIAFESHSVPELPSLPELVIQKIPEEQLSERFDIGHNIQNRKAFTDLDISFPIEKGPELLLKLRSMFLAAGIESAFFGHAGDGNWHIHAFHAGNSPSELKNLLSTFDLLLRECGGHLSGEHGIGRIHMTRYRSVTGTSKSRYFSAIKTMFDPGGRLPDFF
jgi:glycolate oxidase